MEDRKVQLMGKHTSKGNTAARMKVNESRLAKGLLAKGFHRKLMRFIAEVPSPAVQYYQEWLQQRETGVSLEHQQLRLGRS